MSAFKGLSRLGRHGIWALGTILLFVIVLSRLPLVDLLRHVTSGGLGELIWAHKKYGLLAALLLTAGVAAGLLFLRRGRLLIFLATIVIVGGGILVGVYQYQVHYPRSGLFDIERYQDAATILVGKGALLSRFDPITTLVLDRQVVTRAAFPAIDAHFHLESLSPTITPERLVQAMDAVGIAKIVNLGGLPGGMFEHFAKTFYAKYPDRFILFAKPDPGALMHGDDVSSQIEWIKRAIHMGARGLKENKSYGLEQRDQSGKIVPIDDPRWSPVWEFAGQLGMPVVIHTGDPTSFFRPVDVHNERYPELLKFPQWSIYDMRGEPTQAQLMQQREHLLALHPHTNFIGAHIGMNPDNLAYASYLLDKYPNYYVDMAAVISELGREPYSARKFFLKYQDRILFGTDGGYGLQPDKNWTPERMYRSYFEFLETENDYIEYPLMDITKQGLWHVYGIGLPRDVLEKIYVKNAERLIPSTADILARLDKLEAH